MPRSKRGQHEIDRLAETLLAHVRDAEVLDMELLATSAVEAIRADPTTRLLMVDPGSLPHDCSVAAFYDPSTDPPTLRVARDASPGRRAFSALHEYAHHLRNQVDELLLALLEEPDMGRQLEEDVCDAFAARVLAPPTEVRRLLPDGVTASAVLALFGLLPASRQACAIAAARHLASPGYIILLGPSGTADFTASHGGLPPVGRGMPQDDPTVLRAARVDGVRGSGRIRVSPSVAGHELLLDAAGDGRTTVLVAVTDSPAWGGLTVGRQTFVEGAHGHCSACDREFVSYTRPCGECGEPHCPNCQACQCDVRPVARGSRACLACRMRLPPAAFATPQADVCTDCG